VPEIRLHGRGGQGVVTAAELLALAAFAEGRHAQAFPSFGSERTGAPVIAFCRISDQPIRTHEPIAHPDALVIQDATLLHQVDLFAGLREDGTVLVNTTRSVAELGLQELAAARRVVAVPATRLGREHIGRPLSGTAMLGALAAVTGVVGLASLGAAIRERLPGPLTEGNVAAAQAAYALEAHDAPAA
jgi:pyruvate ferredoxin oxidoreductase gamma subunit